MDKRIGKIQRIHFGFGGYDDAMIGVSVTLGSDKDSWGVDYFKGTWATRSEHAKWSAEDQTRIWGETTAWVRDLLLDAKRRDIAALVGTPIEATFDDGNLKSWRVLTEVI